MAGITTLALTGLAIGAQVHSMEEQKAGQRQAKRDNEKANRIAQAQTAQDRAKARRRAIAEGRMATAFNTAAAGAQGVSERSSQLQGSQASIGSTLAGNVAADNRSLRSGTGIFNARQSGIDAINKGNSSASTFNSLSNLFSTGASFANEYMNPSSIDTGSTYIGGGSAGLGKYRVNP